MGIRPTKPLDLKELKRIPRDLLQIIVDYSKECAWDPTPIDYWNQKEGYLGGITNHQDHLYVCTWRTLSAVSTYNLKGQIISKYFHFDDPVCIDIDEKKSLLYIADNEQFHIFNLELKKQKDWRLPCSRGFHRFIKADGDIVYLTISSEHQIFICNIDDGIILTKWGKEKESAKKAEFNSPRGITADDKYVYICDYHNNRVQLLTKNEGKFFTQWGGNGQTCRFCGPTSIYHHKAEEIVYIGDEESVQLFTKNGVCIQRLSISGFGVCCFGDRLYISGRDTDRILIYKRK